MKKGLLKKKAYWIRFVILVGLAWIVIGAIPKEAGAQKQPGKEKVRTNVSPKVIVSAGKNLPFDDFISTINPIFQKKTGKRVVDPQGRTKEIGVQVAGMYYTDALSKVLQANGLTYTETKNAFLIEEANATKAPVSEDSSEKDGQGGKLNVNLGTRSIRIDAILFNLNLTKVRNRGLRWNAILGSTQGGGGRGGGAGGGGGSMSGGGSSGGAGAGGSGGTGTGGQGGGGGTFTIDTENLFQSVEGVLNPPEEIPFSRFRRFLNLIESEGYGRTIANPQITVQNKQKGEIQVGQDIPIQTTDFAGNTITKFVSTGVIINVTPTLFSEAVSDTSGAPVLDFIHMDVQVEDSNSQPSSAGTIINRNQINTEVVLLDGEAVAIGGLISTQKSISRSGVPILKDLPGWFFGLRYIFGNTVKNVSKRELVIVLKAEVVDSLEKRARQEAEDDLLFDRRRQAREAVRRLDGNLPEKTALDTSETLGPDTRTKLKEDSEKQDSGSGQDESGKEKSEETGSSERESEGNS